MPCVPIVERCAAPGPLPDLPGPQIGVPAASWVILVVAAIVAWELLRRVLLAYLEGELHRIVQDHQTKQP